MFIKTPLLLFRQLPDVFLTMVKSFLYAKNKAKKIQEKKEESKAGKREMEKSRKLFAATRLTLGFLGTNFFTFIIMKNYIVGKGVLFL